MLTCKLNVIAVCILTPAVLKYFVVYEMHFSFLHVSKNVYCVSRTGFVVVVVLQNIGLPWMGGIYDNQIVAE